MAVQFLFGQFLGGLTTAMFLFLIASGLSLVFGVLRVLNFAHGSFYMLGAYIAWQIVHGSRRSPEASGSRPSAPRLASPCSASSSSGCCSDICTARRNCTSCCSPTRWC